MPRPRIKICGLTTPDDIRAAANAGADAIGLNFYPHSPRYVDPRAAGPLLHALPPLLDAVGVFLDQPFRQMWALTAWTCQVASRSAPDAKTRKRSGGSWRPCGGRNSPQFLLRHPHFLVRRPFFLVRRSAA